MAARGAEFYQLSWNYTTFGLNTNVPDSAVSIAASNAFAKTNPSQNLGLLAPRGSNAPTSRQEMCSRVDNLDVKKYVIS